MSTTRQALRQALGEEYTGLAFVATCTATGATSYAIDATRLAGPFSSDRWPRGTPLRLWHSSTAYDSFLDRYDPSTGYVYVSPVFATTPSSGDTVEIWSALDVIDRADEAINRSLQNHCYRWVPTLVSHVPDGDMGLSTYTDWTTTASGGTPTVSKVAMSFPNFWANRYLRVQTGGGVTASKTVSTSIPCRAEQTWIFEACVRSTAGAAEIKAYDETNGAYITLSTLNEYGSSGTYGAWTRLQTQFDVPSGCRAWHVELYVASASSDVHFTQVAAWPSEARTFPLPPRVDSIDSVGGITIRLGEQPEDFGFTPWKSLGLSCSVDDYAHGVVVNFNAPLRSYPLYVEQLLPYEELTADGSTTEAPKELVLCGAAVELYKPFARRNIGVRAENGYISPSDWKARLDDAMRDLARIKQYQGAKSKWEV